MGFHLTKPYTAEPSAAILSHPENAYPRSQLQVSGLRSYSPGLGRWLNVDPLAHISPDSLSLWRAGASSPARLFLTWGALLREMRHLYRFGLNDPQNEVDPFGLACTVRFKCALVKSTPDGKCDKQCEYSCTSIPGQRTASMGGALNCEDLPETITTTRGHRATGSPLCHLTGGLCGRKGKCEKESTWKKIYTDSGVLDRDCSRAACLKGCTTVYDDAISACNLFPSGAAKRACKALAKGAKAVCSDGCNSWCQKP